MWKKITQDWIFESLEAVEMRKMYFCKIIPFQCRKPHKFVQDNWHNHQTNRQNSRKLNYTLNNGEMEKWILDG